MSNNAVGGLYATIIDRIIEASRNDFEEGGIPQETLEELKTKWRENLSGLNVAQLPWDPPPTPPQLSHPPPLPSNVKAEPSAGNSAAAASQAKNNHVNSGPQVKQEPGEPGYQGYGGGANGYATQGVNPVAGQRAASLLQQQFGSQAAASIHAAGLTQQPRPLSLPGQQQQAPQRQQRPTHIQMPGQPQQQQRVPQHPQQQSNLGTAQTDGSGDAEERWADIVSQRRGVSEQERAAADGMLRAQLERNVAYIDSGLFEPVSPKPRTRHVARTTGSKEAHIPQLDGASDDEDVKTEIELDEDAINSDLDDKDDVDENVDDDGDGPVGETILCTYDKVQRVKNKWKCTLKDGILTTSGKEYVFHKANGEFEW